MRCVVRYCGGMNIWLTLGAGRQIYVVSFRLFIGNTTSCERDSCVRYGENPTSSTGNAASDGTTMVMLESGSAEDSAIAFW